MLVCLDCYRTFNEDEIADWYETHGLDSPPYEHFSGCPYCHGAYAETHRCDCCGEWIDTDTYVEIGDEKYCENCFTIKNIGE